MYSFVFLYKVVFLMVLPVDKLLYKVQFLQIKMHGTARSKII